MLMSRRSVPQVAELRRSVEDEMLSEMHDALYCLGNDLSDYTSPGDKLLPADLSKDEKPEKTMAKAHIRKLYAAFKAAKKGK